MEVKSPLILPVDIFSIQSRLGLALNILLLLDPLLDAVLYCSLVDLVFHALELIKQILLAVSTGLIHLAQKVDVAAIPVDSFGVTQHVKVILQIVTGESDRLVSLSEQLNDLGAVKADWFLHFEHNGIKLIRL